ncbi:MAG TPA: carboxypeptidase-like regulatory domain-containing protein [Longimicrobium sp.]|jgi:hypothetical protein
MTHTRTPLLLFLALLALPAALHGQARLDVTVLDSAGAPVANARVEIAGVNYAVTTNERGIGRMDRVPAGNRIVSASRIGYTAARVAVEFRAGEAVARTITLRSEPVALAGVSGTAARNDQTLARNGFYGRQRMGHGAFMTGEAIDRLRPAKTVDLFRRMRGFSVILTRRGYYEISTNRGPSSMRGSCDGPLIFLDNILVPSRSSSREDMLSFINPESIAGIEAYPSPATVPAQYNITGAACGVVVMWTKTGP